MPNIQQAHLGKPNEGKTTWNQSKKWIDGNVFPSWIDNSPNQLKTYIENQFSGVTTIAGIITVLVPILKELVVTTMVCARICRFLVKHYYKRFREDL